MLHKIIINSYNLLAGTKSAFLYRALFFFLFVAPVIVMSIINYSDLDRESTTSTLAKMRALSVLSAAIIHENLDDILHIGISYATNPEFIEYTKKGDWKGALGITIQALDIFPFFDRIALLDPEGVIKADMPHAIPSVVGQSRADREWYKSVKGSWNPRISGVFIRGAEPRVPVVSVTVPIKTLSSMTKAEQSAARGEQKVIGILHFQVKLNIFNHWINNVDTGPGSIINIVDQYGRLVYHPKYNKEKTLTDFSSVDIVAKVLRGIGGSEVYYNPIEKEERLAAYEPIFTYGWGVVLTQPTRLAFIEKNKRLHDAIITYSLIVSLAGAMALLILYSIVNRKQAEDALRESEDRYRLISENAGDVIWLWDLYANRYIYVSPSVEILRGFTATEVMQQTLNDALPQEFQWLLTDELPRRVQAMESGDEAARVRSYEINQWCKNGTIVPTEVMTTFITDQQGKATYIQGVTRNITERKLAVETLRENERRLHMIVEHVNDAFYIHDFQGNITDLNDNACRMLGYTREELLAGGLPLIDTTVNSELMLERMSHLIRDGFVVFEGQHKRKDGIVVEVNVSGRIVSRDGNGIVQSFVSDITERKRMEKALQSSEEAAHAILNASQASIVLLDRAGIVLDSNKTHALRLQTIREALIGKCIWDYFPAELSERRRGFVETVFETGQAVHYEDERADKWNDIVIEPIFDGQGTVNRVAVYIQDITDRKQAEVEKEKLEAQNRQLQKTESLGRMAGAIAHHFNNQLGVVVGNLEMAIEGLSRGAEPVNRLSTAMQAAWRAAEMSGLMLTYLGQSFDNREPLDLSDACRSTLPMLQTVMPGKVAVEADLPSPGPIIVANATQIQQIMSNLAINAGESFDKSRGTIHLNVKTVNPAEIPAAQRFPIGWQPQDTAYACLEVTDTGGGISDEGIEKIFDPFFSSKFTGRGMGLAVVLGIVRAHGGVITVESKPDRGSTFRVFFPVSGEEVLRQPDKDSSAPVIEEGGTVLLVDDEEMVRSMAAAMLKRLGFSVLEAKDGVEAVEVFREHQDEIRCVLSDLTMPRMNGWETLTALRKLSPGISVIMASGYDKAHVMTGDHPELPQAFLGKPYNLKGLREAISQALYKE